MEEKPSTARIALKWGGILGLTLCVYTLILFLTNNVGNSLLGWISFAITVGGLVMAMREFRTRNGGFMNYGEGVGVGALTAAISGLLSSLFSTFYTTLIDTGVMQRVIEQTRVKLEDSGLSDEQIDQQMAFMEKFQSPGLTFLFGVLGAAFMGLILSLIVAAVLRRKKTNPFD